MSELSKSALKPPAGKPLGTNWPYKYISKLVIPLMNIWIKKDWRGVQNLPAQGPVLVVSNHLSYADALVLAHFLFANGRAPRFLGKASLFTVPVVGKILNAAGQIPVHRETDGASDALISGVKLLELGHCLALYPEGTLTRDENSWPMVAKTGAARMAVTAKVPVLPVAQWGDQNFIPRYGGRIVFWKRHKVSVLAGKPIDMSNWYGKIDDPEAMREATAHIMREITKLLEQIRGESAPTKIYDPHISGLPRFGNPKKAK
jgi:1-acyl-sn-glycerol-3-phosphate acyltransferase